jgi:hypothetical protein
MLITHITDPEGKTWLVSLQLLPSRHGIGLRERFIGRLSKKPKDPNKKTGWADFFTYSPIPDSVDDLRLLLIFIVIAIVFTFIGWPLLLVIADLIWLLLVLLGALMSFVILKRPITISAKNREETYYWKVRGLAEARKRKQEIVLALSRGEKAVGYSSSSSSSMSA